MQSMPDALGNDYIVLITEIFANVSHAESLTQGLANEQFNWRPGPGRWSIAQNLGHLNAVNGSDLTPLRKAIEEGRSRQRTGEGPFTYGLLSNKWVAAAEPPVRRKRKAPKSYEPPAAAADPVTTLAEYRRISGEMRQLVQASAGLNLARVKTTLPTLPAVWRAIFKMPLGARLALLAAHDRRHLWQAEEVRQHPEFPW
jgi:hypothetical protein